jgi:hypothetical protein
MNDSEFISIHYGGVEYCSYSLVPDPLSLQNFLNFQKLWVVRRRTIGVKEGHRQTWKDHWVQVDTLVLMDSI